MARAFLTILAALTAALAAVYQIVLSPILQQWGWGRVIEPLNNVNCERVPQLKACEKIVLHQPTGILYLACSSPSSRGQWTPAVDRLNASARSEDDYVATYDPSTSTVARLSISGHALPRGISVHGMDVVPSSSNPSELFIYLVNHRVPLDGDAAKIGADSSIEVFKTAVGRSAMTHVRTFEDPNFIVTPNDVVGSNDGKSIFSTNDRGQRVGMMRWLEVLGWSATSVAYCHADQGCKVAIGKMHGNNGITRARDNDTFYVANSFFGQVRVLERQSDNTLVLTDVIATDRPMDNLAVDQAGSLWGAGLPDVFKLLHYLDHTHDTRVPSTALRFSRNTDASSFYGKKYNIEKVFEDDGSLASGSTSVVYDSERNRLFLHGLYSPHLTVCRL